MTICLWLVLVVVVVVVVVVGSGIDLLSFFSNPTALRLARQRVNLKVVNATVIHSGFSWNKIRLCQRQIPQLMLQKSGVHSLTSWAIGRKIRVKYPIIHTTWKGSMAIATPMYVLVYHGPLLIHLMGVALRHRSFHYGVSRVLYIQVQVPEKIPDPVVDVRRVVTQTGLNIHGRVCCRKDDLFFSRL